MSRPATINDLRLLAKKYYGKQYPSYAELKKFGDLRATSTWLAIVHHAQGTPGSTLPIMMDKNDPNDEDEDEFVLPDGLDIVLEDDPDDKCRWWIIN